MGFLLVLLMVGLVCGAIAAAIANSKGRSVVGWFFFGLSMGFLFTIFGVVPIIIVAVLPNLKEEAARRSRADLENRRLREQLRQEQMKGETFRQYSMNRLDAHDAALGTDTRALPGAEPQTAPQLDWVDGAAMPPPPPNPTEAKWYYEQLGQARGPVPLADIHRMVETNQLAPQTLVWCDGMLDWAPASAVAGLPSQTPM